MRVIVTHPAPRAARVAQRLRGHGFDALPLPFTQVTALADGDDEDALHASIARADWVIPVSPTAIEHLFVRIGAPRRWPARAGIALIGPGSEQALEEYGIDRRAVRVLVPDEAPFDAAHLIECAPLNQPEGLRIIVVRGQRGRDDWIDTLRARGAQVDVLALYCNAPIQVAQERRAELVDARHPRTAWVFSSRDIAERCSQWLGDAVSEIGRRDVAIAVHGAIVEMLHSRGWQDVRLIEPGESALLAALESVR